MAIDLVVPAATIEASEVSPGYAALEQPVTLRIGAVQFPDGSPLTAAELRSATAHLYRWTGPAAAAEVWNPAAKAWQAPGATSPEELGGVPLAPTDGATPSWEGLVLALGAKDAAGGKQFAPAVGSHPEYRLRGAFRAGRNGVAAFGLGPQSPPLRFRSAAAEARFAVTLDPDDPARATHVRLALRDGAQRVVGSLELDHSGLVRLARFDAAGNPLATVQIEPDGAIRLQPGGGQKVVIDGDLETERVTYRPAGGGAKQVLG